MCVPDVALCPKQQGTAVRQRMELRPVLVRLRHGGFSAGVLSFFAANAGIAKS